MYCLLCVCVGNVGRVGDYVGMWASVWGHWEVGCLRERKEVTGGFVGGSDQSRGGQHVWEGNDDRMVKCSKTLRFPKNTASPSAFVHRPPLNKRAISHSDKPAISACYKRHKFRCCHLKLAHLLDGASAIDRLSPITLCNHTLHAMPASAAMAADGLRPVAVPVMNEICVSLPSVGLQRLLRLLRLLVGGE